MLRACQRFRWSYRPRQVTAGSDNKNPLYRQLGIENFEPMKPYFLDMNAATRAYLPSLPSFGSFEVPVDNISANSESRDQIPALVSFQSSRVILSSFLNSSHLNNKGNYVLFIAWKALQ